MAATAPPAQQDEFWWAEPPLKERLPVRPAWRAQGSRRYVPEGTPAQVIRDVIRIVSLLWQNGAIIPIEKFYIDPFDEGLLFGRGVWESTRTIRAMPWLWPLHIERLHARPNS